MELITAVLLVVLIIMAVPAIAALVRPAPGTRRDPVIIIIGVLVAIVIIYWLLGGTLSLP